MGLLQGSKEMHNVWTIDNNSGQNLVFLGIRGLKADRF